MKSVVTARIVAVAALACLAAADAHAISRHDPTTMTCRQVHATIAAKGAVLLRYRSPRNPALTLYDRYVRSRAMCDMGQILEQVTVPSADRQSCPVYRCKFEALDDRDIIIRP